MAEFVLYKIIIFLIVLFFQIRTLQVFQPCMGKKRLVFLLQPVECNSAVSFINLDADSVPVASHGSDQGRSDATEWIENRIPPKREHPG